MPSPSTLAVYAVTAVLVLVVPGPAVLYIVSQSFRRGRAAGLVAVAGIHTGTLVQLAAAVAGASWLLVSSAAAFSVVRYLGAAYLVYLGLRRLLARSEEPVARVDVPGEPLPLARLFSHGLLVNVLNPKLALFFFAFVPQFVDRSRGAAGGQVAVLGLVFLLLGLCTDGGYALAAGTVGPLVRERAGFLRAERYVTGTTFIGLGVAAAVAGADRHR